MTQVRPEIRAKAAEVSAKLRAVQADLAEHDDQLRREYLTETVNSAMDGLTPGDRELLLSELSERFPAWEGGSSAAEGHAPAPTESLADRRELKDPAFLMERLIEVFKGLGDTEKAAVRRRLDDAGVTPQGSMTWPADAAAEIRKNLYSGDGPIDAAGVLRSLIVLADFTTRLDNLVWTLCRELAPRSGIKRGRPVSEVLAKLTAGDRAVSANEFKSQVEQLRQLTAGALTCLRVAESEGMRLVEALTPESVAAAVREEGKKPSAQNCWKKHEELSAELLRRFQADFRRSMSDQLEMMAGASR